MGSLCSMSAAPVGRRRGWRRRALLLPILSMLLLVLGGCGPRIVYDFVPPETQEGRICAAQCQNAAAQCRQMQQMMAQQCRNTYNLMQQNYNACKEGGGQHCIRPASCPYVSTSECAQNYRECFAACGGRVISRLVE